MAFYSQMLQNQLYPSAADEMSHRLSNEEKLALSNYMAAGDDSKGRSWCFDVNKKLRNGLLPSDFDDEQRNSIQLIDNAIAKQIAITQPELVFRGCSGQVVFGDFLPGDKIRSLSFWSTSRCRNEAESFAKHDPMHLLQLKLVEGIRVFDSAIHDLYDHDENEIIIPRGTLWKIESCGNEGEFKILTLEAIC